MAAPTAHQTIVAVWAHVCVDDAVYRELMDTWPVLVDLATTRGQFEKARSLLAARDAIIAARDLVVVCRREAGLI